MVPKDMVTQDVVTKYVVTEDVAPCVVIVIITVCGHSVVSEEMVIVWSLQCGYLVGHYVVVTMCGHCHVVTCVATVCSQ